MTTLAVSTERPVDAAVVAALADIDSAARGASIDYFVGGAAARDLVLFHVYGQRTGRVTRDVDLMVCVDSWRAYGSFRARLFSSATYWEDPSLVHRLWHGGKKPDGVPLDVLPFGSLEGPKGTIAWPPDGTVLMAVTGFAEAQATAIRVQVADGVFATVAALPALAVTKLAAWLDRHIETTKDATDLRFLLESYHAAGNEDRLYGTETEHLAEEEFDPERAGARLLGRDAMAMAGGVVRQLLVRFGQEQRDALRRQMLVSSLREEEDPGTTRVERLLAAFWRGLQKGSGSE